MINGGLKERRKCVQIPIPEKDGNGIEYTVIPNYIPCDELMTKNERNFFSKLRNVVMKMREKNSEYSFLQICPQVAVNKLITVNNKRDFRLERNIWAKSVDFVIYDINRNKIICVIELDDKAHLENIDTIKRDFSIEKAFKNCKITLVRIPAKGNWNYTEEYIVERFKKFNIIDWDWES